jgi:CRP/FNR family nitrogen fixation transcriptional regulator
MLSQAQSTFIHFTAPTTIKDPEVRGLLAHTQPGVVQFYPENATIYAQGDAVEHLYLVEYGTVRICQMTPDGRRQITSFCFAGDVFGLEPGGERQFYAESVDGTGVRVLRPSNEAGFTTKFLSLAMRRFAHMQAHLVVLGRMGATEKMCHFLLDLLERQDSDDVIHLPMQRNDVADYLGLTFETVSRTLRVLKDRSLIRVPSADRVEVLDVGALASMRD